MIDGRKLIEDAQAKAVQDQDPFELLLKGDFDGFVELTELDEKRWVTISGRHVYVGRGGGLTAGPGGPPVSIPGVGSNIGDKPKSKPKEKPKEKPKDKTEEKPKQKPPAKISRISADDENESPITKDEAKKWGGERGQIANEAVYEMNKKGRIGLVSKDGDEVVGVCSLRPDGDAIHLDYLATKRGGFGEQMMAQACQVAADSGKALTLEALPAANGFYEKMGMKKTPNRNFVGEQLDIFDFTPQQAAAFASKRKHLLKEAKEKDLVEYEPKNGAFAKKQSKAVKK